MTTYIKTIQDANGDIIAPRTRVEAVVLEDGSTSLDEVLVGFEEAIGDVEYTVDTISSDVDTLTTEVATKAPLASPTFTGTPTLNGVGRMIADSASTGTDIYYVWSGTQAEYDAISVKDANTLYFIV